MYTFRELRKAKKNQVDGKKIKIAVLGNCATQFFSTAIEGNAKLEGINLNVYDADYNQIDAQLLDPSSEVFNFKPDCIVLWLATDKIYEEFMDLPISERDDFAQQYINRIKQYWDLIAKHSTAKIMQMNFTEIDDKALGHYSAKIQTTFIYQLRKLNWLLQEAMNVNANVYPIDLLSIQIQLGASEYYDASYYYNAKMPISTKALPYVSKAIVDVLKSMIGRIKKCIVLDLDNTLWGGVIGDDGISNIEIGELGIGHAFTNFQRWLKLLKSYGIILAVCSKNNEEIAKEPFEKNEEMVLHLDDISLFVANWDDKATNIKMIKETLNIGMDSIVFIDDNPFERNLVREMIPDIEVPELPEDPAHYLEFLQECNYFDTVSYTGTMADRTKMYQAELERKKAEIQYDSIDDYLKSLEMVGEALPFEETKYSRIAQLTQRSNQFNLRTIRYTENDIKEISQNDKYVTLYYTLSDKFGNHGVVGVVIMKYVNSNELFVDTWLMSCRVLKRGMEEYIVNKFVEKAKEKNIGKISAEYIPTAKNKMVENIYGQMGFSKVDENRYELNVDDYQYKEVFIKEE